MAEKMLFGSVIDSQGVSFIAHLIGNGQYIDGEWVENEEVPTEIIGVILPISDDMRKYAENGTYTTKEKKLLTTTPLPEGTECEYNGNLYTIEAFKDLSDYTDVNIYVMRWRKK